MASPGPHDPTGPHPSYLLRFHGGPFPGTHLTELPWPLPARFDGQHGAYLKINESQISDADAATMPRILRGAEYDWEPVTRLPSPPEDDPR